MTDRIKKINELIHHELGNLILKEVEFPKESLVTITGVDTSSDLRHANVYVSVIPPSLGRAAIQALYDAKLHFILYKKLSLKPLPKIHFRQDITEEKASHIESLLDEIKKKE